MSPRQQARLLDRLEREHGASIRKAFEQAIRDLRARVDVGRLQAAIAAGDIAAAVAAIGLAEPLFRDFEQEVARAFEQAGRRFLDIFPKRLRDPSGAIVRLDFDVRHPQAERWLRTMSSRLVTRTIAEQREAIQEALTDALQRGVNPRTSALDIVGRIDPTTRRRAGGIIGLSRPQAGYVRNARAYLQAADPRYFGLTLRDKRFDGAVRRAMEAGRAVPADVRQRALTSYSNRLLRHRGQVVAQTETLNALRAGKFEAERQGIEQAEIPRDLVKKRWRHSGKREARIDHLSYAGTTVGIDEPFILPSGARMMHPGDASLGAGGGDIISCACMSETVIDFIELQARREGV